MTDRIGTESPFALAAERIADIEGLDRASAVAAKIWGIIPAPVLRALQGKQAGHALHPLLVAIPIGSWSAAVLLDAMPDRDRSAQTLVGLGTLTAAPSAWTGIADWMRADTRQRRIGIVHAAANAVGAALAGGSWLARATGHRGAGRLLLLGALGAASAGGFLGGHLTYRMGAGVEPIGPEDGSVAPRLRPDADSMPL